MGVVEVGLLGDFSFAYFEYNNMDYLELLSKSEIQSLNSLSDSTSFIQKTVCECGGYLSKHPHNVFNLKIPSDLSQFQFYNWLADKIHIPTSSHCVNKLCKRNSLKGWTQFLNPIKKLIFSLEWQTKSLDSLLKFILGLDPELDLSQLTGDPTKVYLQGMILSGEQRTIYIQISPCKIYADLSQEPSNIYIEYLNFFMLQYSMFPVMLIYSIEDFGVSEYIEKNSLLAAALNNYYSFLCGENEMIEEICFFCWNSNHEPCQEIHSRLYWQCKCGLLNMKNVMICQFCKEPQRALTEHDQNSCILCFNNLTSTYCLSCFKIAQCSKCANSIYKTQSAACLTCEQWLEFYKCKTCNKSIQETQVMCYSCFLYSFAENRKCVHSKKQDCFQCYFDFKCGVCRKPKLVNEFKYCWKCKNKLIDGLCINKCKFYPASNSYVCADCVKEGNKCNHEHVLTQQSKNECFDCRGLYNYFNNPDKDQYRVFCNECGMDLEKTIKGCVLCESTLSQHDCRELTVCKICYPLLNICSCGARMLSKFSNCKVCNKAQTPRKVAKKSVKNPDLNKKLCKTCGFANDLNSLFCENCNESFDLASSFKHTCSMCNSVTSSKYCKNCYKVYNCSSCFNDLLIGQGVYCGYCNSKTINRVCRTCKLIVPLSKLLCSPCTLLSWRCICEYSNMSNSTKCERCSNPRIVSCELCQKPSIIPMKPWRTSHSPEKPLLFDVFCCKECSSNLPKCTCGFIMLPSETNCKVCDRINPR